MFSGKKGISWPLGNVATIILGIIIFVICFLVLMGIFLKTGVIAPDWVCKTSVALSSATFAFAENFGLDSIMCYTKDIESEAKEKEDALYDIAEHMRKCWNMWGEGKLNPKGKNIWRGGEQKCFTCYKMSFPELNERVTSEDIYKYLEDFGDDKEKLKNEQNYLNYFKQSNPDNMVDVILPDVIDKDKSYGITYIEYVKPSVVLNLVASSAIGYKTGTVICAVGTLAGVITFGTSVIACGVVAMGGAIVGGIAPVAIDEAWNKLEKVPSVDGITFITYDSAKENCETTIRIEPDKAELKKYIGWEE